MPLVNFTQEDINRLRDPDQGWHLFEITKSTEETSSKGDSINYWFEAQVKDGASKGRGLRFMCNSKPVGFRELIQLCMAVNNLKEEDLQPGQLNTDAWVGKDVYINVKDDVYNGRVTKKVNGFASVQQGVPF